MKCILKESTVTMVTKAINNGVHKTADRRVDTGHGLPESTRLSMTALREVGPGPSKAEENTG